MTPVPCAPQLGPRWMQDSSPGPPACPLLASPRGQAGQLFPSAHLEGATKAPCPASCPLRGLEGGPSGWGRPRLGAQVLSRRFHKVECPSTPLGGIMKG